MKNLNWFMKHLWLVVACYALVNQWYEMSTIFVLMAIYNAIEDGNK